MQMRSSEQFETYFILFYEKILHAQKAQRHNQAKAQNANKRISDFLPLRCFLSV